MPNFGDLQGVAKHSIAYTTPMDTNPIPGTKLDQTSPQETLAEKASYDITIISR